LIADQGGAVAPTFGLSLLALVAVGGIAFDYARMASMDTELQNAADHAALAAASQLTGAGACARAARAAGAAVGGTDAMVVNIALQANDNQGLAVTTDSDPAAGGEDELQCNATGNIRFYKDKGKTDPATTDEEAKFVEVRVNPREAFYALTPVVSAFSSGSMVAVAFAGLGEAYCKVPPVMICNPTELTDDGNFDFEGLVGVGLSLVSVGSGSGSWAPGNFGYLDMEGLSNGAPGLREGLGWGTPPINCVSADGLDTKPGATVDVVDSLNTRFDIYDNSACPAGGTCPAAINSVKDVVRSVNAGTNGNGCRVHNSGWGLPAGYYGETLPSSNAALPTTTTPTAMGHPRDICHAVSANGVCSGGRVGDGIWDRDAYFRTNYVRSSVGTDGEAVGTRWTSADWQAATGLPANTTRYAVYVWEMENRYDLTGVPVDGVQVLRPTPPGATGSAKIARGTPVCSPAQGYGAGTIPSDTTPDRRTFSVAIVNCVEQGVNGSSTGLQTVGFLDAFLVEPSIARSRNGRGDIYVEVVGYSTNAVQLVQKKVPYLIE
jgi:Flp pilus assembly protein TadG